MVTMVLNHKSAEEDMLLQQSSLSKTKKQAKAKAAAAASGDAVDGDGDGSGPTTAAPATTAVSTAASTAAAAGGATATTTVGAEEEEEEAEEGEEPSITHELGFAVDVTCVSSNRGNANGGGSGNGGEEEEGGRAPAPKLSVLLRELPIRNPDECFGDDAREDTTGLNLWAAAIVLGRWMASPAVQALLEGKTVLELGAGCGAG